MTALGAMLAMAWAASSGPVITPRRRPASTGPLDVPGGVVVADMGALRCFKGSGDQEGAKRFAGLEIVEGTCDFGERLSRRDEGVELELAVHVAVDERGDVDGRTHRSVVGA